MVFSSLIFLFSFLPVILILYYVWSNRNWKNLILLIASLYFYAWGEKEKVFVMIGSILLNYLVGRWMDKQKQLDRKKYILTLGIIINLGVLVYFKYSKFFLEQFNQILELFNISVIEGVKFEKLPIGISFYTFQSISYLIDVFRKQVKAQKNVVDLGLYIALFPQLIAGPIVRYSEIASQLRNRVHSLSGFNIGGKRFIIGLGKKMLIANPIGFMVDEIYALPLDEISTPVAWLAAIGYSLQIYFDFSAYCDMAIGLGRMFGFNLPENFNYPYAARSIREFWRKWHITLSVWFRDYLYIPLGGSKGKTIAVYRNLIIVFLITGLWHGASWSFIIWGLFHGTFIVLERSGFSNFLQKLPKYVQNLYTLLIVVFAWVFFRIESISDALEMQKIMLGISNASNFYSLDMFLNLNILIMMVVGVILSYPIYNIVEEKIKFLQNQYVDKLLYISIFFFSILEVVNGTYNPFIYFRF